MSSGQRSQVWRLKCMETAGTHLHCSVSSHQLVVKVDADLGNGVVTSEDESTDDVVSTITASLKARNLRPSHHHSLAKVLQHEREGGGGVAESVCTMQHHEPVIVMIHLLYVPGDARPVSHGHVGGVQQLRPLVDTVGDPLLNIGYGGQHQHLIIAQDLGCKLLVVECSQSSEVAGENMFRRHQNILIIPGHTNGSSSVEHKHLVNNPGVDIFMSWNHSVLVKTTLNTDNEMRQASLLIKYKENIFCATSKFEVVMFFTQEISHTSNIYDLTISWNESDFSVFINILP